MARDMAVFTATTIACLGVFDGNCCHLLEDDVLSSASPMDQSTLEQLEAALDAVGRDLAPRIEELARRSTAGQLTDDERLEYTEIVRLNDMLSILKLETKDVWAVRAAS